MVIFIPDLSDEEVTEQIERVTGYLTAQNATITNVNSDSPWGRRRIAYTIRFNSVDYRDGVYVVIHFEAVPSVITEIERDLKLDTRVMRYLLVLNDPTIVEEEEEAGDESEAVETPDAAAPVAEVASSDAGEAAVATEDAVAAVDEEAVTAADADVAVEESGVATEEADVAAEEADVATEEVDVAAAEAEVANEEADVAAAQVDESEDSKKED
jgi:small subunit ribosomal protein S6